MLNPLQQAQRYWGWNSKNYILTIFIYNTSLWAYHALGYINLSLTYLYFGLHFLWMPSIHFVVCFWRKATLSILSIFTILVTFVSSSQNLKCRSTTISCNAQNSCWHLDWVNTFYLTHGFSIVPWQTLQGYATTLIHVYNVFLLQVNINVAIVCEVLFRGGYTSMDMSQDTWHNIG